MKETIKKFAIWAIIVVNIMWAAWIFAAIWRGYDFYIVWNSIIMVTLFLLAWRMSRRIEALTEEKAKWKSIAAMADYEKGQIEESFYDIRRAISEAKTAGVAPQDILAEVEEKLIKVINGVIRG